MIILDATTKSLQVKLSAAVTANQLPFTTSYIDTTGTSTVPIAQDGLSNGTTAVTLVSAPAASTQRLVKSIIIQNADTAAATVTIIYNNNSTLRNMFVATLAVGDQLIYEDGQGWSCVDTNGNLKTSAVGSGGGGTPGGSNGQVQYNNAGVFGGLANGQLPATATNDNAAAGHIGEYISSTVLTTSPVSLTTNTATNVTSITLTAGDWDVWGNICYLPASTTNFTQIIASINTVSATIPSLTVAGIQLLQHPFSVGGDQIINAGIYRVSIAATTTVYLIGFAVFSVSTMGACGTIAARRAR